MKLLDQHEVAAVAGGTFVLVPVGVAVGAVVGAVAGAAAVASVPVAGLVLSDTGALIMSQANGINVGAGVTAVANQTQSWLTQQCQTWGALPNQLLGALLPQSTTSCSC